MIWRSAAVLAAFLPIWSDLQPVAASAADDVVHVAPGYVHSCALTAEGAVYCWGMEHVNGLAESTTRAQRVEKLPRAVALASGHVNSCILDAGGAVWCWGVDLQASVEAKRAVVGGPMRVTNLPAASMIASGHLHSCAIAKSDGAVWCWGANAAGELGDGSTTDRALPVRAGQLMGATAIAAGINNTCAIASGGEVYCWGTDLQSGDGEIVNSRLPTRMSLQDRFTKIANGRNFFCGLTKARRVTCFGSNILNQLGDAALGKTYTIGSPAGLAEIRDVGTGGFFGCALMDAGNVRCWGHLPGATDTTFEGVDPQDVPGISQALTLGVGIATACTLDTRGQVLCWGNNQTGQTGNGRASDVESVPTAVLGLQPGEAAGLQSGRAFETKRGFAGHRFLRDLPVPVDGALAPAWWMLGKAQSRLGGYGPN